MTSLRASPLPPHAARSAVGGARSDFAARRCLRAADADCRLIDDIGADGGNIPHRDRAGGDTPTPIARRRDYPCLARPLIVLPDVYYYRGLLIAAIGGARISCDILMRAVSRLMAECRHSPVSVEAQGVSPRVPSYCRAPIAAIIADTLPACAAGADGIYAALLSADALRRQCRHLASRHAWRAVYFIYG